MRVHWPERGLDEIVYGLDGLRTSALFFGHLSFASAHFQWSKRIYFSDGLSALLHQPYIADAYLCGRQRFGGDTFWWREPGDFDDAATFWAASSSPIEDAPVAFETAITAASDWWIFPPDGGRPAPLTVVFGAPERAADGDYEASFSIRCRFFERAAKVRGLDGVQALMTMRKAAESYVSRKQAEGYALDLEEKPDSELMKLYPFWPFPVRD